MHKKLQTNKKQIFSLVEVNLFFFQETEKTLDLIRRLEMHPYTVYLNFVKLVWYP